MKARKRIVLVTTSAALAVGAGTGAAIAATSNGTPPPGGGAPPAAAAIATYLGLTSDQIQTQLKAGKTLAQIASANGKTVAGLEAVLLADAKTHLDSNVAAGTLTAAQETTKLADLTSHLDDIVNSNGPPAGGMHGGPGGGGPASKAIATYLGLTADQIQTQLKAGNTLAQIATANGKTVAGLEAAILADAKTHLDADVTAGKLTAAEETTKLADLTSHVADMVNSTGPPAGGRRGGPGGPGPGAPGSTTGTSSITSNTFRLSGHTLSAPLAR